MAKNVEVKDVNITSEDKKGNPVFEATGTLEGTAFIARTIQYKGEPIFKLQEAGGHMKMSESAYSRGDRIAVARACKAARLEKFGDGAKARVEPELETGETVTIAATVDADADTASTEELEAAAEVMEGLTADQHALLERIAELDEEAAA
tara:strand:- start:218 stop:667 length:450 start_codon:yes stop_codon:yes gene_type:complete